MVNYQATALDRTFAALADPTRRALLARLSRKDGLSVSELAEPFDMSLPAVMKHIDVLTDAGLLARNKQGRVVSCRFTATPMEQASEWLNRYTKFWNDRLDKLTAFLEDEIMADKPSLTITRRINAAPAKVFAAWTDPEKVKHWMGPGEVKVLKVESDPKTGGRYRWLMQAPDGEHHDVSGVYREVVPNEKLVFTWAWKSTPERESVVTVLIKPDGGGSLLTLKHEQFFDETARDHHNQGWTGAVEKLVKYLEG